MSILRRVSVLYLLSSTLFFGFVPGSRAQDKPAVESKKQLEEQAKQITEEAKALEKDGKLREAEAKYIDAEAITTTREGVTGLERVRADEVKRVQSLLTEAHGLYDSGNAQDAVSKLETALELAPANPAIHYNLALSYVKLNDKVKAISELDQCLQLLPDGDKARSQLEQMKSSLATGEQPQVIKPDVASQIDRFNSAVWDQNRSSSGLVDSEELKEGGAAAKATAPCSQMKDLEASLPKSPALLFNLAKCAEEDGRQDDALRYLNEYLASAPAAIDAADVQLRVANDSSLVSISGPKGEEVRSLYAAAMREIDLRRYDRAMENLLKAEQVAPDYPQTKWRLALLYESSGNISEARTHYTSYQTLEPSDEGKKEAADRLSNLDKERAEYDSSVGEARAIIAPLLLKSMGLDDNSSGESQSRRAAIPIGMMFGAAPQPTGVNNISYAYIRETIDGARQKLDAAASIFPLGPEVNELLAFVYMQGNNPAAAMRCYDIVASQHLPASFYGRILSAREPKIAREAKIELVRDNVRIIYLSNYDPKTKKVMPPTEPAGGDKLGNLIIASSVSAPPSGDDAWKATDLKGVETKNNLIAINTGTDQVYVEPLNVTSVTPFEGVPARKFANNYTRLFLRYMAYDSTKLGPEHMTGGEKFSLGMSFAAAGMGGYAAFAGVGSYMMTTQLMYSMYALNSAMSTLRRSQAEQRELVEGNDFKIIPSQSFDLTFREKFE